ncbi:MAG: glycine--tRNA ligase [Candidatus Bathyarchaeia archaeon]
MPSVDLYDRVLELSRRRGFFWPSFEIYGGVGGFIDFGPLGAKIMWKLKNHWRDFFVRLEGLLEIITPVITPSRVFEASGHVEHFRDPMVTCLSCEKKFRADQLLEEVVGKRFEGKPLETIDFFIAEKNVRCPECGGKLSRSEFFTTMFRTTIGPYSEEVAYGRPEAAQGMFLDFKRVYETARERFPLGIAQIGRAMRNEISPRQGPIRLREFTIMEFEFFFDPENPMCEKLPSIENLEINLLPSLVREKGVEEPVKITLRKAVEEGFITSEWLAYFMGKSVKFLEQLGIEPDDQRFEEKLPTERAHYSLQTFDQQVKLDRWGWTEVAGFAYRGDYDLKRHALYSKVDMRIFKGYEQPVEKVIRSIHPVEGEMIKLFGERAKLVLEKLREAEPEEVYSQLGRQGFFKLGEFTIPASCFLREEKRVKETGARFIPHVVEPSFGAERLLYAILEKAYSVKEGRVVLQLPSFLSPYDVAVFPLVSKNGLNDYSYKLSQQLLYQGFDVFYDEKGSIGRRYARADEAGIPAAITIDYQTMQDDTVTVRDRDSWSQIRVDVKRLDSYLTELLKRSKRIE